jgi:hypothetical protein
MCDSEKKRVADLSCSSGDCDSNGLLGLRLGYLLLTKVAKVDLAKNFISTLIIYKQDILMDM